MKPLVIELFAGLHGWGEAFAAEGYRVVGFDLFDMPLMLGKPRPKGDIQLVLQDVLTLHGAQFKDAAVIVASPPCQQFSYMAMPWTRSKALAAWYRDPEAATERIAQLTALFDACFRTQREASEAAGHRIPLIVENVKGAQPWVGSARWHYGSFYLWGDVPALMPMTIQALKWGDCRARRFDERPKGNVAAHREGHTKNDGGSWFGIGSPGQRETGQNPVNGVKNGAATREEKYSLTCPRMDGTKNARNWWSDGAGSLSATTSSKSSARKAASAMIAKIPFPLAQHIARTFKPDTERCA